MTGYGGGWGKDEAKKVRPKKVKIARDAYTYVVYL